MMPFRCLFFTLFELNLRVFEILSRVLFYGAPCVHYTFIDEIYFNILSLVELPN
jgi:hypothetical protein